MMNDEIVPKIGEKEGTQFELELPPVDPPDGVKGHVPKEGSNKIFLDIIKIIAGVLVAGGVLVWGLNFITNVSERIGGLENFQNAEENVNSDLKKQNDNLIQKDKELDQDLDDLKEDQNELEKELIRNRSE